VLDRIAPDLVHVHCVQRLTATLVDRIRLRGTPYVITLHDGWWVSPHQFLIGDTPVVDLYDFAPAARANLPDRARTLMRPLQGAARRLAVSEPFAQIYRHAGVDRVDVLENAVSNLPETSRRPSGSGRIRLGHIGGRTRHKGIHLVKSALMARRFEMFELLVIDHAMAPHAVRHEVWGTTPVTFRGKVAQDQVAELYADFDILLAPSTWPESFGLVSREAVQAGLWVIATDLGAMGADIVEGENGFVIDVSSYLPLADRLAQIASDPDRYLTRPEIVPDLRSLDQHMADLVAVYDDVLSEASRRS